MTCTRILVYAGGALSIALALAAVAPPISAQSPARPPAQPTASSPALVPASGAGRGILVGVDDAPASVTADESAPTSNLVLSFVDEDEAVDVPLARFAMLAGGHRDLNALERDRLGNPAAERRYVRDSVEAGMTIADGIVIDDALLTSTSAALSSGAALDLVLVGHLEEAEYPQAHPDSTILWIDVTRAGARTSHPVVARDLMRRSPCESHDRYQEAVIRLESDAVAGQSDAAGNDAGSPIRKAGSAEAIVPHLRMRYAGTATVALSRIELRVSWASER